MGTSRNNFHKYPRTPHILGSTGTSDDKRLGQSDSARILGDISLIVEEKLDGTNVGLHFAGDQLILQCRGHEITPGMHPQYDLFKQWAQVKQEVLHSILGNQFIIYGEWMYARHCIYYERLSHYFFEFDIFDKDNGHFLTLGDRLARLKNTGIKTVPVLHRGQISMEALPNLVAASQFESKFENPETGRTDNLMEGLYLRTEMNGSVTSRAKLVRPEFVEKIKLSKHWQYERMVQNQLAQNADIWS